MGNEIITETINEAAKALLGRLEAPSETQSTFIVGIRGTEQDRREFEEQCRAAMKKTKRDKYSFLDGVVGRGKGRAKSQGYAQHFKM